MKKGNALITVLALLVSIVAANLMASRHPLRLDLTDRRLYTLSDATRKILAGLDDIVTVRAYFTENLPPALKVLRRDVEDTLAEFKGAAGPRLKVEWLDPGSSQMEEQKAAMMGIPPVQVNVVERDKQEVAKIFLGMAVMFGDRQQVIPVVRDAGNLEYDLAEAIVKVSAKELPKVGWWEPGRDEAPEGEGFSLIQEALSRRYDIEQLDAKGLADLTAKSFGALVVASPRAMSEDELVALDQYIMGGGRALLLVDRFEVGPDLKIAPIESGAFELLAGYGAEIADSIVLDQSNAMAAFSGGVVTYHLPYPYWPEVRRGGFAKGEPIVAELESAVLPWTSPINLSGERREAIATSSSLSAEAPANGARLDPQSAAAALGAGPHGSKALIALIEGPFKSRYASGKAPLKGGEIKAEAQAGARLLVAGSSRWMSDRVLRTFPQNATLFENALDSFAMGDALIGIRSREETSRPIAILSDGARATIKYANLAVGPLVLLGVGAAIFLVRRGRWIRDQKPESRSQKPEERQKGFIPAS